MKMKTLVVAALALALVACASTHLVPLGSGQYIAVREQNGGFPSESSMILATRDAAVRQCGSLDAVRVIETSASASSRWLGEGSSGRALLRFECVTPPTHAPVPAVGGGPATHRVTIERDEHGLPVF